MDKNDRALSEYQEGLAAKKKGGEGLNKEGIRKKKDWHTM